MDETLRAMNKLTIEDLVYEKIQGGQECPFRRLEGESPYCQLMPYTNRLKVPLIKCDYQACTIVLNERLRPYHRCQYAPSVVMRV